MGMTSGGHPSADHAAVAMRHRAALLCVLVAVIAGCDPLVSGSPDLGRREGDFARENRLIAANLEYAVGHGLDVYTPWPPAEAPLPAVVMLHGCCGDRADLVKLAEHTAGAGVVVLNADWPGIGMHGRYPDAYATAACAVRFARVHAARYGGDPQRVTLVGWSDGALAAAVIALAPDELPRASCRSAVALGVVRVVGVDGFYGWQLPVHERFVTARSKRFLGGSPDAAPRDWRDATPYHWIGRRRDAQVTLIIGARSPLMSDARTFARALDGAGNTADLVVLPSAPGSSPLSPRTEEGRLAAQMIAAVARAESDHGDSDR